MFKIMVIFGTRPEAIKMIPIIKKIEMKDNMESVIVSTGQHKEMLDQILSTFFIEPNYNLDVMEPNQKLPILTSKIINNLTDVLDKENPDIVLVHGDTTTTFSASLASFYQKIPIGHIEAGLRTYDKYSPFPEEINRQLTDRLTDLFFAPTLQAKENLEKENLKGSIFVTGNTAIDMINYTIDNQYTNPLFKKNKKTILLTMHRRENIGEPMEHVFEAVNHITKQYHDINFVFPCHKNPKVKLIADKFFSKNEKVAVIDPVNVVELHNMMKRSFLVLTDSGGIQEETPTFNIPLLVLRDTTERPEGVEAGVAKLIGTETSRIFKEISTLLDDTQSYFSMCKNKNPYGDGCASDRIIDIIDSYLNI